MTTGVSTGSSPAEPERWTADFQAPPTDVDVVWAMMQRIWAAVPEVDQMARMRFETALIELAGNIFEHAAASRSITLRLEVEATCTALEAALVDTGDPAEVDLAPRAMPDELAERGRGIPMIQLLVDELDYRRDGDTNRWRIAMRLAG